MAQTNVFRGSDATLVLAVDDTATVEGGLAESLIGEYELSNGVGRLQNVEVKVFNELRPYHEIGKRFATELRPGNLDVVGTADRAYINGALLRLLLGEGNRGQAAAQPSFNAVISLKNPALPENTQKITVFGIKFENWSFTLPEDDFVMESVSFRALRISCSEESS